MTDRTHPDSGRIITSSDVIADLHARIAELEAQLESIRAGGVNSPLMGQPQAMPDLTALTERGAKAWTGVDAQALREGRWYMVTHDGVATLCEDRRDAEQEAKDADMAWPHSGPHRAVQLVEASTAGFTAADMATASAQGFRDGVASLSANAGEPSGHIKEPYTLAEIKAKIVSNDYSAEMLLQHAMLLLDSASLAASVGEPVAWLVCTEEGDPDMVFLDRLEACQYCEDDDPPKPLYLAAPPTAQAEGWRPIETAPKDKSNIVLLRQPCGSIANGFWLAEAYAGNGAWIWPYIHKTPTHWMPLPPPPTSAEGGRSMSRPDNPNNCTTCRHKQNPDGGHCYMFRLEPTEMCAQHTSQIHALQALRMQFGRVFEDVIRK